MQKVLSAILLCVLALPVFSQEKQSSDNPFSAINKRGYERTKGILLRAAEKMPDENYSFRHADTVRSYGQIIGHLAAGGRPISILLDRFRREKSWFEHRKVQDFESRSGRRAHLRSDGFVQ